MTLRAPPPTPPRLAAPLTPSLRRRAGYTLLEILACVSIIFALAGLLLGLGVYAQNWSKNRNTTTAMAYLHNASLIYSRAMGAPVPDIESSNYFAANTPSQPLVRLTPMAFFLWRMKSLPDCTAQIDRVPDSLRAPVLNAAGNPLVDADGNLMKVNIYFQENAADTPLLMATNYALETLNDAWGQELQYCAHAATSDLPERKLKLKEFMPYAAFPYFASAGKDGKWGAFPDRQPPSKPADEVKADEAKTKDNIYSMTENQ